MKVRMRLNSETDYPQLEVSFEDNDEVIALACACENYQEFMMEPTKLDPLIRSLRETDPTHLIADPDGWVRQE